MLTCGGDQGETSWPSVRGPWWYRLAGALWALVRQRCPRCWKGRIFRGVLTMNDPCPVCCLIFQREEGYFLGAMYFSYLLSLVLVVPLFFLASALLPTWNVILVSLVAVLPYLPMIPLVFRYSRVLWIYFDRYTGPCALSAGPFEKARQRELDKQKAGSAT